MATTVFDDDVMEIPAPVPAIKKEAPAVEGLPLHPWQVEVMAWIGDRENNKNVRHRYAKPCTQSHAIKPNNLLGGLVCMQMGMGKTRTILEHIKLTHTPGQATLLVIPNSALHTWKSEVPIWWPQAKMLVFHSSVTQVQDVTRAQLDAYDLVLVTFNLLTSVASQELPDQPAEDPQQPNTQRVTFINAITDTSNRKHNYNRPSFPLAPNATQGPLLVLSKKWKRVVVDESHLISNMKTARFQSAMTLCSDITWCLTGTPMRNKVEDLYSQIKFIGHQETEVNEKRFRSRFDVDFFTVFLSYQDVNYTLPPCTEAMVPVPMTPVQHQLYSKVLQLTQEAMEKLRDKELDKKIKYVDILTMFTYLRMVSSCPAALTPPPVNHDGEQDEVLEALQNVMQLDHVSKLVRDVYGEGGMFCPKLNKTMELITETPDDAQVIVFSMFKKPMQLLAARCEQIGVKHVLVNGDVTGLEREEALTAFKRDPSIKVLIISFQVGAESLNLANATVAIFLDTWFCPATLAQAKARINRFGQTKPTIVHQLVAEASIEEGIYEIVERKLKDINVYLGKLPENTVVDYNTLYSILHNKLEKKRKRDFDFGRFDEDDIDTPTSAKHQAL
jgi:SNF2 family DNA or RNA helicase